MSNVWNEFGGDEGRYETSRYSTSSMVQAQPRNGLTCDVMLSVSLDRAQVREGNLINSRIEAIRCLSLSPISFHVMAFTASDICKVSPSGPVCLLF